MPLSTRFAVAVHACGVIAVRGNEEPVTSEAVAESVDTNPVVVRRVIAMLAKKGIVAVRKGQHGGASLARPAGEIRLDEIYQAVEPESLFGIPVSSPHHTCPIAQCVGPILQRFFHRAETGMLDSLREITLQQVIDAVKERAGCLPPGKRK